MLNRWSSLIVGLLLLAPPARGVPQSEPPPRIGFVLPLSGDWAFLGVGIRDAALLAARDLRAAGTPVDLMFEDNHGELAPSAAIGSELVSIKHVDAVVSIISGVAKLLAPIAGRAGILSVGICSETEVADGKLAFINYLTAEQGVDAFVQRLGSGRSVGVFSLNESGFQRILAELRRRSPAANISLLFEETFESGTADFRPLLLKYKARSPDALLILGLSPEIELLARQARALGIRASLTSIESFGLAQDKQPFEGAWFVDSASPNAAFRERYLTEYHREITAGTGHAYDTVMMLSRALGQARNSNGTVDRKRAAEAFRAISGYQGVIGPLSVRADGVVWSTPSIKTIADGKAQLEAR